MIVNVMNNKVFYTLPEDSLCTQESPIFNTLQIPRGGEYFLTLADGTEVWLNAETEIRYPVQFTGNKRVVYLDGEAYFTVAPDKKKPFTVVSLMPACPCWEHNSTSGLIPTSGTCRQRLFPVP